MRRMMAAALCLSLGMLGSITMVRAETARANLHQIRGSKVKAKIVFLDNGSSISVAGVAVGLDDTEDYVSLVYDTSSTPSGPNPCMSMDSIFVGQWVVAPDGSGTLIGALPPGSLPFVGTMSIRLASFALQACGRVNIDDD